MSKQNKEVIDNLGLKGALKALLEGSFRKKYPHPLSNMIDAQKKHILESSQDSIFTKIDRLEKFLTIHQVFADTHKMPAPLKAMVKDELAFVKILKAKVEQANKNKSGAQATQPKTQQKIEKEAQPIATQFKAISQQLKKDDSVVQETEPSPEPTTRMRRS